MDVRETTDGGFIVTGFAGFGVGGDVYLVKTDASGGLDWERNYGGNAEEIGLSVHETADRGYFVGGWTETDQKRRIYLLKTDPEGALEWEKTFGGGVYAEAMSIEKTSDDGFILTGTKGKDLLLAKIRLDRSGRAALLTSAPVERLASRKESAE